MNRIGRRAALLAGLLLPACAHSPQVRREALPDGTYRLDCKVGLAQCLTAIEEVCREGYEILRAHQDVRVAGPREFTEPTLTSEAIARCRLEPALFGRRTAAPEPTSPGADGAASPPAPAPASATTPTPTTPTPTPTSCFPGATQACTGPGACKGGQQCLPSGAAFGPCDCGGAPTPAPDGPGVEIAPPR